MTEKNRHPKTLIRRTRVLAAVLAAVTLCIGVAARSGWLPSFWAKYIGVALWSVLVYWIVVFVAPRWSPWRVGVTTLGIGWLVEFAQLSPAPAWLASVIPLARWVFGTTYNAPDLIGYLVGAIVATGAHWVLRPLQMGRPGLEPGTSRM